MLGEVIDGMQSHRLSVFLGYWLPRHRGWHQNEDADRFRVYKRDDDLADEMMAASEFGPVAEAFCLRRPRASTLREAVEAAEPGLPEELSDLLVSAILISARRIGDDPSRVPLMRRAAVGVAALREGLSGHRD